MTSFDTGLLTLQARAESWESDFNGHWNTRYYCRCFQDGAEVARALGGQAAPDRAHLPHRLIRFHSELQSGDAVEIRSFAVRDAGEQQLVAHYLLSEGEVAATALDHDPGTIAHLPVLSIDAAGQALPRSLTGPVPSIWQPEAGPDLVGELGPVRREEVDATGYLRIEAQVARLATASHHHAAWLGLTPSVVRDYGIGRVLVELRHVPLAGCNAGEMLRMASRLVTATEKYWITAHLLSTHEGRPIAVFEQCMVAVDLEARRTTRVPDFLQGAADSAR